MHRNFQLCGCDGCTGGLTSGLTDSVPPCGMAQRDLLPHLTTALVSH
jgi:hypothetical protein